MTQTGKRKFIVALISCLMLSWSTAQAQELRVMSYEEAINIALKRSYTVKSHEANLQAMKHSFDFYRAQFKPRIDFSMLAPMFSEGVNMIQQADGLPVYNSTGLMRAGGDLRLTYMLPTGGNLALFSQLYREDLKTVLALKNFDTLKSKQANSSFSLNFDQPIFTKNKLKEELQEAEYSYELSSSRFTRSQMDIIYNVTDGFYSLYQSSRKLEIAKEKLTNSEEAYRIAKLKHESGRIPEGDVLIAEVEMSRNQADLLESDGNLARSKDSFKQLIGLDQEDDFLIETNLEYDSFPVYEAKAIEEALKHRLEINESELEIRLQAIKIDRAKRQREFKGNISAYYDLTGVSTSQNGSTGDLFDSSFENFVDRPPNRGVTLTFSYPVFDWGRGASQVQREEVNLKVRELGRENLKRTIVREVRDVARRVEETKNRLAIHEKSQEITRRSYDISRLRFENGDITSQELGQEQERLADSQIQYLDAFIAYQLAVAELKRSTMWDFKNNRSYLVDTYFQER